MHLGERGRAEQATVSDAAARPVSPSVSATEEKAQELWERGEGASGSDAATPRVGSVTPPHVKQHP